MYVDMEMQKTMTYSSVYRHGFICQKQGLTVMHFLTWAAASFVLLLVLPQGFSERVKGMPQWHHRLLHFDLSLHAESATSQSIQALMRRVQVSAFQQFDSHRTGRLYNISVTDAPSGSFFQAIRLRSGSFKRYGVIINEFMIPTGYQLSPVPERILLVYSDVMDPPFFQSLLEKFSLASPVVAISAYDATDLNTTQVPQMLAIFSATSSPISVRIQPATQVSSALYCASFKDNFTAVDYSALVQGACISNNLGAFALVTNASVSEPVPSPVPSPSILPPPSLSPTLSPSSSLAISPASTSSRSSSWKVALASVVGGLVLLGFLSLLAFGIVTRRQNAKLAMMEYQADQGETLMRANIQNSRVPAAGDTRTQPILENGYSMN